MFLVDFGCVDIDDMGSCSMMFPRYVLPFFALFHLLRFLGTILHLPLLSLLISYVHRFGPSFVEPYIKKK